MPDPVHQFLGENRDTREYRRALAVEMAQQGIAYDTITTILQVSKLFISKWTGIYAEQGVAGFQMGYRGSGGYLTAYHARGVKTCPRE
jgi:transposase